MTIYVYFIDIGCLHANIRRPRHRFEITLFECSFCNGGTYYLCFINICMSSHNCQLRVMSPVSYVHISKHLKQKELCTPMLYSFTLPYKHYGLTPYTYIFGCIYRYSYCYDDNNNDHYYINCGSHYNRLGQYTI